MAHRPSHLFSLQLALVSAALALTGCSAAFTTSSAPTAVAGTALQGTFHGGQAPIAGASIYFFAASTIAYGAANTSLLQPGSPGVSTDTSGLGYVTTGPTGSFTITNDYTCPSPGTQVYLTGYGGNSGLPTSTAANPNIAAIVALGSCGNLASTPQISLNEVTTVAALTSLAQFTNSTTTSISTSPTNILGLNNAFATAANLASIVTGTANTATPSGYGIIPQAEINTLADMLAACINSSGGTAGDGSLCGNLFSYTTPPGTGAAAPTNTMQAMRDLALHPAQNVQNLWNLVGATAPFQPTLTAAYDFYTGQHDLAPASDWTLAIGFPALNSYVAGNSPPDFLAIDSQSNIWFITASTQQVFYLSPTGTILTSVKAPSGPGNSQLQSGSGQELAIDLNDNLWVANNSYGISEISGNTLVTANVTGYGYEPGPGSNTDFGYLRGVFGLTIDSANNVWVGNDDGSNSSMFEVNNANGYLIQNISGGGIEGPDSMAFDQAGYLWIVNNSTSCCNPLTVSVLNPANGTFISGASGFSAGPQGPRPIAIDKAGNAWIGDDGYPTSYLTVLSGSQSTTPGTALFSSPFYTAGLQNPAAIAVDGANNIWVADQSFNASFSGLLEINGSTGVAISPPNGFQQPQNSMGIPSLSSVAIDASGNVWGTGGLSQALNGGVTCCTVSGVVEVIGIAAPTINPIVRATKNNTIGTLP